MSKVLEALYIVFDCVHSTQSEDIDYIRKDEFCFVVVRVLVYPFLYVGVCLLKFDVLNSVCGYLYEVGGCDPGVYGFSFDGEVEVAHAFFGQDDCI